MRIRQDGAVAQAVDDSSSVRDDTPSAVNGSSIVYVQFDSFLSDLTMNAITGSQIRVLSESRGISEHASIDAWGKQERLALVRAELAGVGKKSAEKEMSKRALDKAVISTLIIGFCSAFALLVIGELAMEKGCAAAFEADPYSRITQTCDAIGMLPANAR